MVNNKKAELMSKIALYENSEGKRTLKLNKYYKQDYATSHLLKSAPLGFLTALLIAVLIFFLKNDWPIAMYKELGGTATVIIILASLLVFVIGYCFFAQYMFNHKYENFRGNLRTYGLYLKRLERIYDEEKNKNETKTDDIPV